MVVHNKTNLDKEEMLSSLIKTTKKGQLGKFIISTIIFLCAILLIIYGHMAKESNYLMVGYMFLAFSMVYYGIGLFTILRIPKKVLKQNKEAYEQGVIYDYTFKEQSFQVNVISLGKKTKLPYKYNDIKKILEYENRYEFRLSENLVLFIYKNGFDNPKMEEFFLKNLQKNKKKIKNKIPKNK